MENFSYLTELDGERCNLIKGLQLVQKHESYVSDDAIRAVSKHFLVPEVETEGVLSFYAQFKRKKPGKYQVLICDGTACHIKGTPLIQEWVSHELGIKDGDTDEKDLFSLETVACLGCCSLAPVLSVNGKIFGKLDRKSTLKILKDYRKLG